MTTWYAILISGVSGAVVTLLGVMAGGAVTSRSQRLHWLRDKQIEACAELLRESTSMQIKLRHLWNRGEAADWTAWNQALAMIWLIGTPDVRTKTKQVDRLFWLCRERIKRGQIVGEKAWSEVRDEMELARRDLINAARREMVSSKDFVDDVPVGRPSLSELDQLFDSTNVQATDNPQEAAAQ
jgi:hypothetical protein